jgi:hypothetical protein
VDPNDLAYLGNQIAQGEVILFTGAGFSLRATAEDGRNLPTASQLRDELWALIYGDVDHDDSSLADVYAAALRLQGNATRQLLSQRLKVRREDLPEEYRIWFSFPWYRVYTVNVDNLADIVGIQYDLPRETLTISALREPPPPPEPTARLLVVQLNGTVDDLPNVTFSSRNYAERLTSPDLWYPTLARELTSHPVLFVGSTVDEPSLWQYVEARSSRSRGERELRPRSFIVTPGLSRGRQSLLGEFNVRHEQHTQEHFCAETLTQLTDAATEGVERLRTAGHAAAPALLSLVELAGQRLDDPAELLAGREPRWADVTQGFATEREFDRGTLAAIESEGTRLILLTGTAGAGKTLSAMRLALALSADHSSGYVFNDDFTGGLHAIRDAARNSDARVVVIDDPTRFGRGMVELLTALVDDSPERVVVATLRTTQRDPQTMEELAARGGVEFVVPPLADSDIDALLDALTEAHRLGELRALSRSEQARVFRDKCGGQILVAMIEATSGLRFNEKIASECQQLTGTSVLVYSVLTLATAFGTSLTRAEILMACGGDPTNTNLAFRRLQDQHLIVVDRHDRFLLRHRVIAERALTYFQDHRTLSAPIEGLVFALASTTSPLDRYSRQKRLLRRLLNHAILIRLLFPDTPQQIDLDAVRGVYATVEPLLTDDSHFWLQRGSFEVEEGDLGLARNYLAQARSMSPDDEMVLAEWGYLLLKRASRHAGEPSAAEEAEEAFTMLQAIIDTRGAHTAYPYHIYGSQGLAWVSRSPMGPEARADSLDRLRRVVREGTERHPGHKDLKQLMEDLDREYMMLAVDPVPADGVIPHLQQEAEEKS